MSHEVESMFFMNQTPWHGLGTRVIEIPTIDEAIAASGLNWTVGMKPLFTEQGEKVKHQATFRESDGKILGVVGPGYKPLQNMEAFKFFQPFLDQGAATLETAGSLRGGQRVWVMAKIKSDPLVIVPQSNDIVQSYILLSNSHDGTLAVRVGFTPVRVVCANTMAMAHSSDASKLIRIRHSGNVEEALAAVRDVMNVAKSEFEATAEQFRLLASKQVSRKDLERYVKMVFNVKKDLTVDELDDKSSRVLAKILPLFEKGRGNDLPGVKGTYWAAYNAVNEYLQYERGSEAANRLDSMWFGTSAAVNKKALDTAVGMVLAAA